MAKDLTTKESNELTEAERIEYAPSEEEREHKILQLTADHFADDYSPEFNNVRRMAIKIVEPEFNEWLEKEIRDRRDAKLKEKNPIERIH